jgi:hypothetical protein
MFVVNISFAFSFAMFDYSMRKKIKITFVDGTLFVLNDFKAYNIPWVSMKKIMTVTPQTLQHDHELVLLNLRSIPSLYD